MKNRLTVLVGLLVVAATLFGLAGCGAQSETPSPAEATAISAPVRAEGGVIAEAEVVPLQDATLSFATAGVVEEVLAPEGSQVEKGQPIARLQGSEQVKASIAAAEMELLNARQAKDKLYDNLDVTRAQAALRVAKAEKALDDAKEEATRKRYRRADQDKLDQARAEYILAQDAVEDAEDSFAYFANYDEEDINRAAALSQLAKVRDMRDDAKKRLNWLLENPDPLEIGVADNSLKVAEAELSTAKRDFDELKNGPDPDDLALADARIKNAQAQLDAAKATLDDMVLEAPFGGTVVTNDLKVGERVAPNTPVATLADMATWQVETTDLTELDVVRVKVGGPVKITLDAIPGLELSGKVERIQALGQNKQGDITYKVVITLDQQDERLRWNMTASANFVEE